MDYTEAKSVNIGVMWVKWKRLQSLVMTVNMMVRLVNMTATVISPVSAMLRGMDGARIQEQTYSWTEGR